MEKYSLVGVDGNAYSIMNYVVNALKSIQVEQKVIDEYLKDAKSSDYNHLLFVSMEQIQFVNNELGYELGYPDDDIDGDDYDDEDFDDDF